jgi:NADPH-dependent 2,4-dienoyl-CoA reductase/sulfur reductase-like enzyme
MLLVSTKKYGSNMRNYDVVIIGGGPAGVACAISAKSSYPDKSIALVRKEEKPMIPCGIPYIINTLNNVDENILPDNPLIANNVDIIYSEVLGKGDYTITLKNEEIISYKKLVLATGSKAAMPNIDGINKDGVYLVKKDRDYLVGFKEAVAKANDIVVLGGGYIGVEVTDELVRANKNVTVIEMMNDLLPTMDSEFGNKVKEILVNNGAEIITNKSITKVLGNGIITSVELSDGSTIKSDLFIVSCGYKPNLEIVKQRVRYYC